LADQAAREHRQLASVSTDLIERFQARVNVDFFTAAPASVWTLKR
jgi:hypothetical protein